MKFFRLMWMILFSISILSAQSAFDLGSVFEPEEDSKLVKLVWTGFYEYEPRFFLNDKAPLEYQSVHVLDIGFNIEGQNMAMTGTFQFRDENKLVLSLEELFVSAYLGRFQLHAGKQVVVWGKGDELHIVDLINADNYWDFFFPDYLQRRTGENMLRLNMIVGPYKWNAGLELVYAPGFTKMNFPESGPWKPPVYAALDVVLDAIPQIVLNERNYDELKDGQFAARWTQTTGLLDWGMMWYRGKLRVPSVRYTPDLASSFWPAGTVELRNNPVTVIGIEFGTAMGKLNLRGEAARYLTSDRDGTKPDIINSKWSLLLGGDISLPVSNLNLNVQYQKDFVTEDDPNIPGLDFIKMAQLIAPQLGIDPALFDEGITSGYYDRNMIAVRLGDSFFRDRFKPEIQYVYNVDSKDYMVTLKLSQELRESLNLIGIYRHFQGNAGTVFGQYKNNDFVSLRLEYFF